jgi:hypothetical protein
VSFPLPVPAQVASRARRSASDRTGVSGSPGAGVLTPGGGIPVGLAFALEPAAEVPDPGEPSSGRIAGVVLADLDRAPDVLAVQLGRSGYIGDMERCASSSRRHHRHIFPAQ